MADGYVQAQREAEWNSLPPPHHGPSHDRFCQGKPFEVQEALRPGCLKKVILATTMWEVVDHATGEARENELGTTEDFWGYMIRNQLQMRRHYNKVDSVRRLIRLFVDSPIPGPVNLQIQEEMVD
ncbi:hypothetical protein B0H63DRAFT_472936 [Podospora didyma]|uniref:Uncharacterized protein n=1 Tax=Podospora didyma TaxID=330526 RepID=A0AAE0NPR7_9PEZI|nr:hypothetical protein B0H63DRAFT_472936 [Podospora didyma]